MSHAASTSRLSHLNPDVRDALTDWLADCDLSWARGRLEAQFASLPKELQAYRNLALAELVKINIERCWRIGVKATAESYLDRFPILRADESVEAEVIQVEEDARRRAAPATGTANRRQQDTSKIGRVGADSQVMSAKPAATPKDSNAKKTDNEMPESFGRYRIVRMLGHGGMGDVYLADDTQLNRQVALKVPHFDRRTKAEVLERFDREAKAVANLDHPNICRVHDAGEVDGQRFMVMEFIDGESLNALIESKQNRSGERGGVSPPIVSAEHRGADAAPLAENRWSDDAVIRLVQQIAAAVGAAHSKNIVHRDLKPANIMLTSDGQPKVTDFGLARRIGIDDHKLTHSGMILGTPAYMPPEQLTGELDKVGPHSDVFSLGVILFELLTGHLPHEVPPNTPIAVLCVRILTEPATTPTKFRPDLDPRLEAIILKATAKSHTDRFASMSDFSAALQAVLDAPMNPGERGGVSPPVFCGDSAYRGADATPLANSFTGADAAPLACASIVSLALGPTVSSTVDQDAPTTILFAEVVTDSPSPSSAFQKLRSRWINRSFPARFITIAGCAAALLLGVILFFRNGDALVKIEVSADDVEVTFVGKTIKFTDGEREYRVTPGEHRLHIKTGNAEFDTELFTLKKGNNPAIKIEIVNSEVVAKSGDKEIEWHLPIAAERVEESGTELLANGGCEEPHDGNSITGWSTKFGLWTVETGESFPLEGKACFRPGPSLTAELSQDVSLEPYAEPIQNGQLELSFRGHVLSASGEDQAQFVVQWLDKSKLGVTEFFNTGRMSLTRQWQENSKSGVVPTNAAFVRVTLATTLKKTDGRNVFFDNVSLRARTIENNLPTQPPNTELTPPAAVSPIASVPGTPPLEMARTLKGHKASVRRIVFTPDGTKLASGSYGVSIKRGYFNAGPDNSVRVWDVASGKETRVLGLASPKASRGVQALSISPDGRYLSAAVGYDYFHKYAFPRHYVWDTETWTNRIFYLENVPLLFRAVTFSPDSSVVTATVANNQIKSYKVSDSAARAIPQLKDGSVSIAFADDGKTLLATDNANRVFLWDVEQGSEIAEINRFTKPVRLAAMSSQHDLVLAKADDGWFQSWNVSTKKELFATQAPNLTAVAYAPDGRYFASGWNDGKVTLHDSQTGREVSRIAGHSSAVNCVAFSPKEPLLASGSHDTMIHLWKIADPTPESKERGFLK